VTLNDGKGLLMIINNYLFEQTQTIPDRNSLQQEAVTTKSVECFNSRLATYQ